MKHKHEDNNNGSSRADADQRRDGLSGRNLVDYSLICTHLVHARREPSAGYWRLPVGFAWPRVSDVERAKTPNDLMNYN